VKKKRLTDLAKAYSVSAMKTHIQVCDNAIFVHWMSWGYVTICPDGRYSLWIENEGSLLLASEGIYDWKSGKIEDCPPTLVKALESALKRWADSADGRNWLRKHGIIGGPHAD